GYRSAPARYGSLASNRLHPPAPWVGRRRTLELEQVLENDRNAAAQLMSLGSARALDLLGQVLLIQRQIRADSGRITQRARLLLGPADKILLVKPRGATGT